MKNPNGETPRAKSKLEAIGIDGKTQQPQPADHIPDIGKKVPRGGSKLAALVAMLKEPEGATLARISAELGWKKHTARGAMTNLPKRYPDLAVTSIKPEGATERVYQIRG